jgi:hypothetical protein
VLEATLKLPWLRLPAPGKRPASNDHGAPAAAGNHPGFSAPNGRPARDIRDKREDLTGRTVQLTGTDSLLAPDRYAVVGEAGASGQLI